MKNWHLTLALAGLAGCVAMKDNVTLQRLADEDQHDRRNQVAAVGLHDIAHLQQVRQLIDAKKLHTGQDYFNAAIVLQHADSASDYLLANTLAKKAVALTPQNKAAKTLVAQSWDRYLRRRGQPQWYGTQRYERDGKEYLQPIDTTRVSDAERQAYFVSTLPEKLAYFNKLYNRHETSLRAYILTEAQQRSLEQRPASIELIGSYEALFKALKYPEAAGQHQVAGFVVVEAIIDEQGAVSQASVVKGLGYGCDEEAVRLLKLARYHNPTGAPQEVRVRVPFNAPTKL